MESEAFRLVMRRGPQPNRIFDLTADLMSIGRERQNDIVINDPEISRQHAQLTRQGTGLVIEDLGSTNGTFVNGVRISGPYTLSDGDQVGLGETITLAYLAPVGAESETALSPATPTEEWEQLPPAPLETEPISEPEPVSEPEPIVPSIPWEPAPVEPLPEALQPIGRQPEPVQTLPDVSQLPPWQPEPVEPTPLPPPPLAEASRPVTPPPFTPPPGPEPLPPPPAPYRPPTTATPVPPPQYQYQPPEEKKSRKWLWIGCGCLLLILICAITAGVSYLLWNAPYEFWEDPINNFDRLFGVVQPLLHLL